MLGIPMYIGVPPDRSKARCRQLGELRKFLHNHEHYGLDIVTTTAIKTVDVRITATSVTMKACVGSSWVAMLNSSNELEVSVLDHACHNVLSGIANLGAPVIVEHV